MKNFLIGFGAVVGVYAVIKFASALNESRRLKDTLAQVQQDSAVEKARLQADVQHLQMALQTANAGA